MCMFACIIVDSGRLCPMLWDEMRTKFMLTQALGLKVNIFNFV